MNSFMGSTRARLDSKLRISVPATFRQVLARTEDALVLRSSFKHPAIEGWAQSSFEKLGEPLQRLDLYSEEHDDMALTMYSDACSLVPDREGRVVLPETYVAHAGLTDTALFVGMGRFFQIWEPAAGEAAIRAARARALERRQVLATHPAAHPVAGAGA